MLTKLRVVNFKCLRDVEVELGKAVVLVGPNNSGKTTALQALALWEIGLRNWNEKRSRAISEARPGVTINRRDLIPIPIPNANLLWHGLHVREFQRVDRRPGMKNIRVDIVVSGVSAGKPWECGLEFDYANEESFYCRPLRLSGEGKPKRMPVPEAASDVHVAFLPPMSGLAAIEDRLLPGTINVRIGEGRTADVLRNLCYDIYLKGDDASSEWTRLVDHVGELFGVALDPPILIAERGQVTMSYRDKKDVRLDLASSGRGLQQTLLLLAHLYSNPKTVLLIDEPDAHLEILRQRQTYQLITEIAEQQGCQLIVASHSEVVLNEAADKDVVVAFVGRPHRIDDRGSQLLKSLKEIGYDQYYQAEQTGWVLYLEGPTDLAILRAFAETLDHPAKAALERPFVRPVLNQPQKARDHFFGLREAKHDLVGLALFDRISEPLRQEGPLHELAWQRREIENYLCCPEALFAYAESSAAEVTAGPLFVAREAAQRRAAMEEAINEGRKALAFREQDPFSPDIKVSDEFLDPLFRTYFRKLGLYNLMEKTDYHVLARFVPKNLIDDEVREKLDAIVETAARAKPVASE